MTVHFRPSDNRRSLGQSGVPIRNDSCGFERIRVNSCESFSGGGCEKDKKSDDKFAHQRNKSISFLPFRCIFDGTISVHVRSLSLVCELVASCLHWLSTPAICSGYRHWLSKLSNCTGSFLWLSAPAIGQIGLSVFMLDTNYGSPSATIRRQSNRLLEIW